MTKEIVNSEVNNQVEDDALQVFRMNDLICSELMHCAASPPHAVISLLSHTSEIHYPQLPYQLPRLSS